MRKLTALSVALTLFTAGQAFAGPPHAPTAHAPAAPLGMKSQFEANAKSYAGNASNSNVGVSVSQIANSASEQVADAKANAQAAATKAESQNATSK